MLKAALHRIPEKPYGVVVLAFIPNANKTGIFVGK